MTVVPHGVDHGIDLPLTEVFLINPGKTPKNLPLNAFSGWFTGKFTV